MKSSERKGSATPSKPSKRGGDKPGPYGEGNYEATRQYNEHLKEHVENHDIEQEARDAAPRTDYEEREMREAEAEGKSRSRGEDPALTKKSPKGSAKPKR
jgi:hypothetical protein